MSTLHKIVMGLLSLIVGAGVVIAGFKYSALNWIVDGPGWIVGRFLSLNFHEGEGALGFFLAVLLSWICASVAVFLLLYFAARTLGRPKSA